MTKTPKRFADLTHDEKREIVERFGSPLPDDAKVHVNSMHLVVEELNLSDFTAMQEHFNARRGIAISIPVESERQADASIQQFREASELRLRERAVIEAAVEWDGNGTGYHNPDHTCALENAVSALIAAQEKK